MRILTRLSASCAALLTLLAAGSVAALSSFDFSYTFDDGVVAEGVLEGDIRLSDTNLVDVLSVSVLTVGGVTICDADCAVSAAPANNPEPAIVSLDGALMDIVITPDSFDGTGTLAWSSIDLAVYNNGGGVKRFDYDASRWSLTERVAGAGASPVPEPGAAMLFGAGVLVVASRLRRP